jgi:hypothetical protein
MYVKFAEQSRAGRKSREPWPRPAEKAERQPLFSVFTLTLFLSLSFFGFFFPGITCLSSLAQAHLPLCGVLNSCLLSAPSTCLSHLGNSDKQQQLRPQHLLHRLASVRACCAPPSSSSLQDSAAWLPVSKRCPLFNLFQSLSCRSIDLCVHSSVQVVIPRVVIAE